MRVYGREESFAVSVVLFTHGDRKVDLFVVLGGEVHASLPLGDGNAKVITSHQRFAFLGEFTFLTE